jgi:putative endonuclease
MFFVYTIENLNGKIYTGHTENLVTRLQRHNGELPNKKSNYTSKNKGPWELIYKEKFATREEAIKREKELKTSRGRKFLGQFRKERNR